MSSIEPENSITNIGIHDIPDKNLIESIKNPLCIMVYSVYAAYAKEVTNYFNISSISS